MAPDLSRSRAILIGNGAFADAEQLPSLPASGCVAAIAALLTGELCGWPASRIERLLDIASPSELASRVIKAVRDVHEVLLLYYVGHGQQTSDGRLALALHDTEPGIEELPHTAMLYENLAMILRGCPAATKLVILDCCHAELGNNANFQSSDLAETYPVDGLYFIGASKVWQKAKYDPQAATTYFTQALVDTVYAGLPGRGDQLRLDQIFLALRSRLIRDGLPEPVEAGIRGARQYPFARNAARGTPIATVDADGDPARASRIRILKRAERVVDSIRSDPFIFALLRSYWPGRRDEARRASSLCKIAAALRLDDPGHAADLIALALRMLPEHLSCREAEDVCLAIARIEPEHAVKIAAAIAEDRDRDSVLRQLAKALAAASPDHAEQAARLVSTPGGSASALADIAEKLAETDPGRAEQVADRIGTARERARALAKVAKSIAKLDPSAAHRIVLKISELGEAPSELSDVAHCMAGSDPALAETTAFLIGSQDVRDWALLWIAPLIAHRNIDAALRLCAAIVDPWRAAKAAFYVAEDIAALDPDRAEQLAQTPRHKRAEGLANVARALAGTSPAGAARLLGQAEQASARDNRGAQDRIASTLVETAAVLDLDCAVRVTVSVADPELRVSVFASLCHAVAALDSQQRARIVSSLLQHPAFSGPAVRAGALLAVSKLGFDTAQEPRELLKEAYAAARKIPDRAKQAETLTAIATQLAAHDQDQARRIIDEAEVLARTVEGDYIGGTRAQDALRDIVTAIAWSDDPLIFETLGYHAERIARSMEGGNDAQRDALRALAKSALTIAGDSERAERIVLAISSPEQCIEALIKLSQLHEP